MPLPQHLRLNAFKYPIAFIRVIQIVFVAIALASVNSWSYRLQFDCPDTHKVDATITSFSFDTQKIESCVPVNGTTKEKHELWKEGAGWSSGSGYFYFVQVLVLISAISAIFFYVVLWEMYLANGRIRLADLALTALCFVFLFFCFSTWWSASSGIGSATSKETVTALLTDSPFFWNKTDLSATLVTHTKNGMLTISVLCECVCVVLFALNCWYIWKEIAPTSESNPREIA